MYCRALNLNVDRRFSGTCCLQHNGDDQAALMMEAVRTSETSVDIQLRTWQYIPEDSELLRNFNINDVSGVGYVSERI
jgi:hypothetical protein